MRNSFVSRFFSVCLWLLCLVVMADTPQIGGRANAKDSLPSPELAKIFPARVGDFRSLGYQPHSFSPKDIALEDFGSVLAAQCLYVSPKGEKFTVEVIKAPSDAGAYAILTSMTQRRPGAAMSPPTKLEGVGTAAFASPERLIFFKGATFVSIEGPNEDERIELAQSLAEKLDAGAGEIPVLVRHLPPWEGAQDRAIYAVSLASLQESVGKRPVLDVVSFDGGTEAVTTTYGPAMQLVLIEHSTPQFATDNDARVTQRIQQLRAEGQPVPAAYRRVGNYAVFVFDAPDEKAATQLIDQVKYEKDVRWLGRNPHAIERALKSHMTLAGSVILTTLKVTGLAILVCLGIGSIFGGVIFLRRRTQAATTNNYSDAGGMMRLNIDEMTAQNNPARLLRRGDG